MPRFFRYSSYVYDTLSKNPKHSFAQRHALNLYKAKAIYSFIPKNACSTLRTTVAYTNGCIKNKADFNWIHANNQTFSATLAELASAEYTFTVLRCPFSRLVSVYLDKIVDRTEFAWVYVNNLHNRQISIEDVTFDFFIKSLRNPMVKNGNIHWRPQLDFLVYEEYDDYFALENFSSLEQSLKQRIDVNVIDARALTQHGSDTYKKLSHSNFSHTPPLELLNYKAQGQLPTPKAMYNDELIDIVKQLYQDDIHLYRNVIGSETLMFS